MSAPCKRAVYTEQTLIEFKGNPLIESLPELMESEEILERLTKTPPYDATERKLSAKDRIQQVERIRQFHQPSTTLGSDPVTVKLCEVINHGVIKTGY